MTDYFWGSCDRSQLGWYTTMFLAKDGTLHVSIQYGVPEILPIEMTREMGPSSPTRRRRSPAAVTPPPSATTPSVACALQLSGASDVLPPARRPPRQHLAHHARFSRDGQPHILRLRRGAERSASGDVKTDHTPEPPHYGLRSGYLSALWSVEFNELVRFTHQPSPRPRADIVLMSE